MACVTTESRGPETGRRGAVGPVDTRGRRLLDLRISLTDRCNLRCRYCMPRESFGPGHAFLARDQLLSAAEIERVAGLFVGLGVRKIRLTGGEPLLRRDIVEVVRRLAKLDVDLALTTNGVLLSRLAPALTEAGLGRVTVSLDALDDATFRAISDSRFAVADVLAGIDAAAAASLGPIKINAVVRRGVNDGEVIALAGRFRGTGHTVRFIEYMDVGATNGWTGGEVISAAEIVAALDAHFGIDPVAPNYPGEVAGRYRYRDGSGEVGVISSVSRPFCGDCTRARLSADGRLFACLFAAFGTDLRGPLRSGADDDALAALLSSWWKRRDDRYSELRGAAAKSTPARIEMSFIGG